MTQISGMIICKDEADCIADCLRSLDFCDEIVVVDSGSTDGTQDIVRSFPTRLVERPFESWNDQKEFGRQEVSSEWVLNIDADEIVSPELRAELLALVRESNDTTVAGARMPFRTHFKRRWIRTCGYYPDYHTRFVRKERAHWDVNAVHDRVVVDGKIQQLTGHMEHYSFESIDDFVQKSCRYSNAFAVRAHAIGRRSGLASMLVRPVFRFVKSYIFQRGFTQGNLGFLISMLQAYEVFQKYSRLWERNRSWGDANGE
jgi:(heptosyl)LPS beta-1,4-glucosyltransferase